MTSDPREFTRYLSTHCAHLGDQGRYRERKKRQLLRTYAHLLPQRRDADLLEIGPGHGQWLEALRVDRGYSNAVAIDISEEVVDFCNGVLPGSTTLVSDTVEFLIRRPGCFERIFVFHVLEHVPRGEQARLLAAILGSLKPGGLCLIEVPNMANAWIAAFLRYGDFTHETGFTELSMRQLLTSCGFADVRCFEERVDVRDPRGLLAGAFRQLMGACQRFVYRGYQIPVPAVLTPALCTSASRPHPAP